MSYSEDSDDRQAGKFHTPWITMTKALMERAGVDGSTLAKAVGVSHVLISKQLAGNLRPSLESIDKYADALWLEGSERDNFITQAYLAHSPHRVRQLVEKQTATINRLRAELQTLQKK